MSAPVARINTYRNIGGEIELTVSIDGALIRASLRDEDAARLARDLAYTLGLTRTASVACIPLSKE